MNVFIRGHVDNKTGVIKTIEIKELENKWIQHADKNVEYKIVGMETDDFPGLQP